MKKTIAILFFVMFLITAFGQVDSLKNASLIGQASRNQKVGQGFQIGFVGSSDDTCQINTKLQIVPNAGEGKVLTSDANGFGTWTTPSFWKLTGNASTTPGTNFVGTTDAKNFWLGTNNIPRAYIANTGKMVKMFGDSTVQKIGLQRSYVGTSNDKGGLLLGPTLRYYMDTTGGMGTAVVRAGDNITDWGDSLCIDLLAQHPDYGAVWDATLGMARVRILLVTGAENGTAVVADTSRWFVANGMTNDTVFQIYTETGLAGIQYKNGSQGNGKVLTSDANGNATWQTYGYGEMGFGDSAVTVNLTINTPTKATNATNNLWLNGARDTLDVQYSGDSLIVLKDGTYTINGYVCMEGANGAILTTKIYLNGALLCDCNAYNTLSANRIISIPFTDIKTLSAGDVLEVYVENIADNTDVVMVSGKILVTQIRQ